MVSGLKSRIRCREQNTCPAHTVRGSTIRGARAVHVLGDFVDLPPYSTVKCMSCQAVKGISIAHPAPCPLTASPMSLSWLPAGITITYIQSNGDRVPATIISASECGQYPPLV